MPSALGSNVQLQSPGQGIFDLMKSTSSVNSMTSGNQAAEKLKQSANNPTNFVNIVGMHKSEMKTARKGPKNGDVKSPTNAALSETHSPGVSTIPMLNQVTSVQSTKHVPSTMQTNIKPTQSNKPTKPASTFKPKPSAKPKN